jgi:type I restriction enzyme S subunit
VARLETGHTPSRKKPEYWGGVIPWIGIRDATENHGRIVHDTAEHTNSLGIANSSARVLPAQTVCLSRTASVGYVVVMGRPMATSQDFVNWVCSDQLDWRLLKYILLAEKDSLIRFAHGTTHQTIYFPEVKAFHVCLPPLAEQRRITGVLGALDNKIEHNTRLSSRLAEMARVAFENTVLRRRSDLRPTLLGDLATLSREPADGTQPYIGLDAMPRGSTVLSEWATEGAPSGQALRFRRGDVLFGKLRPYFKKVGVAPIDGRCSTEILVLRPREPQQWGLLLGYVSSEAFISYCVQVSRGTKMPRAEWRDISAFPVGVPSDEQASRLSSDMRLLHESANALVLESKTLASIRDALLPKLVSGALRVPDSYDPDEPLGTGVEVAADLP